MEETVAQEMCQGETGASEEWVTIDLKGATSQDTEVDMSHLPSGAVSGVLKGATSQDTEVGMSHLQNGAVSGVLKEPQKQSGTVKELKCVGKGKELELVPEYIDAINGKVSSLSDTERQLNNLCIEVGLEDVSAIMQKEMDAVKLFMEFSIDMFLTVKKKLEELEQKKQQYNSECSKLSVLLLMIDTKLTCLENCDAAMFKVQFPAFDHVLGDQEIRHINPKLKKHDKQFKSIKALQTQIKKRIERELKEKRQKKEEIEMLCTHLHEAKEVLHKQTAALENYATQALEVHRHTWRKF